MVAHKIFLQVDQVELGNQIVCGNIRKVAII